MQQVKLFLRLIKLSTTLWWRHMGKWRHSSIILNLNTIWSEWSASLPCRLTHEKRGPTTTCIGGWGGGGHVREKRKISRSWPEFNPVSSVFQSVAWSLYRLSYPGSNGPIIRTSSRTCLDRLRDSTKTVIIACFKAQIRSRDLHNIVTWRLKAGIAKPE
jgi:hypothetical protein